VRENSSKVLNLLSENTFLKLSAVCILANLAKAKSPRANKMAREFLEKWYNPNQLIS